ncbi:hypothetical protein EAH68_12880 [Corynebacterium hylobatis]|uniref:Uncharacterized protein n=1 Tax=Corynebacterium hylobatis TaxID=1859290 RepID=A0A3S0HFJ1_9CORY|nr:hypothetical protein [Corynebacterium hylobatis]RSZ61550.1 hypothetical protein EAH68_12880 [Corynebacterium hylobatis]
MKTIPYSTAMEILGWIYSKNGLPYHYGGSGRPGGDCSWFVMAVAAALQGKARDVRYGSTETFRLASGEVLGLVRASSKAAVPADAILKLGFYHNGGGYNSHTSGTFAGVNFESRGMYRGVSGHVVAGTARAWDDPLYHSWWYLPARLGPKPAGAFPLPPQGWYYGPRSGPDQSVSGEAGEPPYMIEGLRELQRALGTTPTGRWADVAGRVRTIQADAGGALGPTTGHVGPKTWAAIINPTTTPTPAPEKKETTMATTLDTDVEATDGTTHRVVDLIRYTDGRVFGLTEVTLPRIEKKLDTVIETNGQIIDMLASLQARAASGDDRQQITIPTTTV